MNELKIIRANGGVPATMPGEDHISGYLAYMTKLPEAFKTEHIHLVGSMGTLEKLGITKESKDWETKLLYYHISEAFRGNPALILYLGLFAKPSGSSYDFAEVKLVQNYAHGSIRQLALWLGDTALATPLLNSLQTVCTKLEAQGMPLSVLLAPKVEALTALPKDLRGSASRVSVVIGEDSEGSKALRTGASGKSVSALGLFLGLLSKAKVNQSFAWVGGFPTGVHLAGFSNGELVRNTDKAVLAELDKAGYIFLVHHPSINGAFISDSHTFDDPTSDYNAIERVRTMDKATRGVRRNLTLELGGNIYIDQKTGKLKPHNIAYLQTVGSRALEEMSVAGELSGYKVVIPAEQNVLATSSIEVLIHNVPVGVVRKLNVTIGYVPKL